MPRKPNPTLAKANAQPVDATSAADGNQEIIFTTKASAGIRTTHGDKKRVGLPGSPTHIIII